MSSLFCIFYNMYGPSGHTILVESEFTIYITEYPGTTGTLTYTGSQLSPVFTNYDPDQLDISGTYSATNAGTYSAVFTPKSGYAFADGSTTKSVSWTINKASTNPATISGTSFTLYSGSYSEDSASATIYKNGASGNATVTNVDMSNEMHGDHFWNQISNSSTTATFSFGKRIGYTGNNYITYTLRLAADTNYPEKYFTVNVSYTA